MGIWARVTRMARVAGVAGVAGVSVIEKTSLVEYGSMKQCIEINQEFDRTQT